MAGGAAAMPRSSEGRVDCTMRLLATALLHTSKGYALGRRSWLFTCDGAVIFGEPICVAGSRASCGAAAPDSSLHSQVKARSIRIFGQAVDRKAKLDNPPKSKHAGARLLASFRRLRDNTVLRKAWGLEASRR